MNRVVVRFVQKACLLRAVFRGEGCGDGIPHLTQFGGDLAQKTVVIFTVVGIDVFKIKIQAVIVFFLQDRYDIVE